MKVEVGGSKLYHRILGFFVALLFSVQLASFLFIRYAIEQTAEDTLRSELRVGKKVFQRLQQLNSQQLVEATSVLTYDFGFREAIASRDGETILSALRNHAARIKASGMAVVGLDGVVVADTLSEKRAGQRYAHPELIGRAAQVGRTSAIRMVDTESFQVVIVPVLAPLPIAWVAMSFIIDDNTARDLEQLSTADVSFVALPTSGPAEIIATTVPRSRREALLAKVPEIVRGGRDGIKVTMGTEEYEALSTPLEEAADFRVYAILQRAVSEGIAPYLLLQAALMIIAGLSLGVTLWGAMRISRRISRPVTALADAAREIAKGNYNVRVGEAGSDEIAELSRAFDGMARGLAERDNMRDVLGKVASSEVVAKLLKGEIELGGQELDATVMFTDIRNFTTICESLTPQQSLQLLNEFLTKISQVVEGHEGVVDKFLGDGVMAVFGAPVTRVDDAQRAIEAALDIAECIAVLRPSLEARGLPSPEVGVGLNTSRVVSGNIGSPSRLNYTVLGDGVNLASRLESLTKRYMVPIVCGTRTRESVKGIVFRELDKVRVRGRSVAERIFEPLGREGDLPAREIETLQRWQAGLEQFRARQFKEARATFEGLAGEAGYPRLVAIYLGYIRDLSASPPEDDWDAAFTLYEK